MTSPTLNMDGPFDLNAPTITKAVTRTSAGNYALGHVREKTFYVQYVGRSDTDVNARLKQHVGKYESFKFSYATSAKAAFEKECKNFHDFGAAEKLNNTIHPDRPENGGWKCPACKIYE